MYLSQMDLIFSVKEWTDLCALSVCVVFMCVGLPCGVVEKKIFGRSAVGNEVGR